MYKTKKEIQTTLKEIQKNLNLYFFKTLSDNRDKILDEITKVKFDVFCSNERINRKNEKGKTPKEILEVKVRKMNELKIDEQIDKLTKYLDVITTKEYYNEALQICSLKNEILSIANDTFKGKIFLDVAVNVLSSNQELRYKLANYLGSYLLNDNYFCFK